MTCWHRLRHWNNAGVRQRPHKVLLAELLAADKRDLSRAVIDSGRSRRPKTGRSPVDRGRPGSKHHLITDAGGVPLTVLLTGGNRNDVTLLMPLLHAIPPIRGRPRSRAPKVCADRGYDHDKYRTLVRELGITPVIARRCTAFAGCPAGHTSFHVDPHGMATMCKLGLDNPISLITEGKADASARDRGRPSRPRAFPTGIYRRTSETP